MSFANYTENINARLQFAPNDIYLKSEPDNVNESARVADTITYLGNATYPLDPPTVATVADTDTTFKTLFVEGENQDDLLRIRADTETLNFTQYANVEFDMYISHSCPSLDLRLAVLDGSLNVVKTYDTVSVDLSGLSINKFTLKGFSVDYPSNGVYSTIQAQNPVGTGNASLTFNYFNSQLENAIDTSIETGASPSRNPINLFVLETYDRVIDISGGGAIISALEADVATLQAGEDTLTDAVAGKLSLTGGTMTGPLKVGTYAVPGGLIAEGYNTPIKCYTGGANDIYFGVTDMTTDPYGYIINGNVSAEVDVGMYIAGKDDTGAFNPIVHFYSKQTENAPGSFSEGRTVVVANDRLAVNGDSLLAGNLKLGTIDDVETTITGLDTEITDLSTTVVDVIDTVKTKVNKSGDTMTGTLSMGGFKITNLQAPVITTDATNKAYVDNAVATGGNVPISQLPCPVSFPDSTNGSGLTITGTTPSIDLLKGENSYRIINDNGFKIVNPGGTAPNIRFNMLSAGPAEWKVGQWGLSAENDRPIWKSPVQPSTFLNAYPGDLSPIYALQQLIITEQGGFRTVPLEANLNVWLGDPPAQCNVSVRNNLDNASNIAVIDILINNNIAPSSNGIQDNLLLNVVMDNRTQRNSGAPTANNLTLLVRCWKDFNFTVPSPVIVQSDNPNALVSSKTLVVGPLMMKGVNININSGRFAGTFEDTLYNQITFSTTQ